MFKTGWLLQKWEVRWPSAFLGIGTCQSTGSSRTDDRDRDWQIRTPLRALALVGRSKASSAFRLDM